MLFSGISAAAASLAWTGSTAGHGNPGNGGHGVQFTPATDLAPADRERHERYMSMTLDIVDKEGGPFGTIIVDRTSGKVLCRTKNRRRDGRIFHAEMVALDVCSRIDPPVDWRDLTLYTSGESCAMCASAEVWAGIPEVVYATSIERLTAYGVSQIRLDSPTVAAAAPFYRGHIIGGVLEERANAFYEQWAKRLR